MFWWFGFNIVDLGIEARCLLAALSSDQSVLNIKNMTREEMEETEDKKVYERPESLFFFVFCTFS